MIAARVTRRNTTVNGGNSLSTTPLKKNEPPHSTESRPSSDQSRASIEASFVVITVISAATPLYSAAPGIATRFPTSLFRPRHDLDHPAFVFVRHLSFRAGIGLDRGSPEQWCVCQQGLGQFHRVGRILVAKRRCKRCAREIT